MKGRITGFVLAVIALAVLSACGGKKPVQSFDVPRKFPSAPAVPSMITDRTEARQYVASHFWDSFLSGYYPCDSTIVNGVPAEEVENAFARYVALLEEACPHDFAKKEVAGLFRKVEKYQATDPSSNVFGFFEKMTAKFLYDPNSPMRDEDLYLQYVRQLSSSRFVEDDMKPAYSNDARLCSLNQVGTKAADIVFTDRYGKKHNLHGIEADHILLFFSNPGCQACKEIVDQLGGSARAGELVESGRLAIVSVYIDLEREKWMDLSSEYPRTWINGYDQNYKVRSEETYNVRAIPSLYVLDKDKKVVMKDAPTEKVLSYLEKL